MYTAKQARELVSARQQPTETPGLEHPEVDACILDHIKNGWLCANIRHLLSNASEIYHVGKYLKGLGYTIDKDGIVYWHLA